MDNQNFEKKNTNSGDKIGPLVGSVIIILIIILGAFYLFSTIKDKVKVEDTNSQSAESDKENNFDDIQTLELDLDSTDVEEMKTELQSIEAEFQI